MNPSSSSSSSSSSVYGARTRTAMVVARRRRRIDVDVDVDVVTAGGGWFQCQRARAVRAFAASSHGRDGWDDDDSASPPSSSSPGRGRRSAYGGTEDAEDGRGGGRSGGRSGGSNTNTNARRSWSSTRDARYNKLENKTQRRAAGDKAGLNENDGSMKGFRAVDATTLMRRTEAAERRRQGSAANSRGDGEDKYWGVDEELSGWARLMGETPSVDARKKKATAASDDDVGPGETTAASDTRAGGYKRGGERPWEISRRKREAKKAEDDARARYEGRFYGDEDASREPMSAFARAGMPERAVVAMREAGLKRTTEIQRLALPVILEQKNVAILAETGSGKTFSYLLPILAQMTEPGRRGTKRSGRCCPAAVVLVPNVELGKQVTYSAQLAASWCTNEGLPTPRVFSLVGKEKKLVKPAAKGVKKKSTTKAGKSTKLDGDVEAIPEFRTADILVCTPARLLKLIKEEWVLLGRLCHVVVDEADEMLSSGFGADVAELISMTYSGNGVNKFDIPVQYIFAAATMREAQPLLEAFPGELEWISTTQFGRVHPQLEVRVDDVAGEDAKFNALIQALARRKRFKALIFANSPEEADELVTKLDESEITALAFHGKAKERGVVLDDFISGDLAVCVCTDLAARGIDFPKLHHVVQYGAAPSMEMHLHRCGRTARTGQEGPFFVSCVVDSKNETVDADVAQALGLKRRYDRASAAASSPEVV